jgi:hypothetical protein
VSEGGAFLVMCPWDVEVWFASDSFLGLDLEAQGAYLNLCLRAWQRQPTCALPDDDELLWRLAGARSREQWATLRQRVLRAGGWTLGAEGWTHPTVLDTYTESADRHTRAVRAGRIAGKVSARVRRELSKQERLRTTVQRSLNGRQPAVAVAVAVAVKRPPLPPSPSAQGERSLEAARDDLVQFWIENGGHPTRKDRRRIWDALRAGHATEALRHSILEELKAEAH